MTKWVDFQPSGIQCNVCGGSASYMGCDKHKDKYPILTKKNFIRVPNCPKCFIECNECQCDNQTLPEYLKKVKKPKKLPKIIKQKKKEPKIKSSFPDKIRNADLSKLRDLNIYRDSTEGILNLIFSFDIGTQLALEKIEKKLISIGLETNLGPMRSTNDRLSRLLYTILMIRTAGLSSYEKEIMEAELEKLYGPKISESKGQILELLRSYTKLRE